MDKVGELLRNPLAIYTYVTSSVLITSSGFGLNGKYLLVFFSSLLIIFTTLALFQDNEHIGLPYKSIFHFNIKIVILLLAALVWISISDFFLVELFKIYAIDISDTVYWNILFGSLVPFFLITSSILYFIGTSHISNSIRIVILSTFFLNSNLNDLLYYKLFSEALPNSWSWVTQPQFMFEGGVSTSELLIWTSVSLVLGIIASMFPYEILVWDKAEESFDFQKTNRQRFIEILVLIIFVVTNIVLAKTMIDRTKENLSDLRRNYNQQLQNTSQKIEQKLTKLSLSNSPLNTGEQRLTVAYEIIQNLQDQYQSNGQYPISIGNCNETWDSSANGLPFNTAERVFKDPAEINTENCFIDEENSRIMYYSDGNRFALVLNGQNIDKNSNLYLPNQNDVRWFESETYFQKDWGWNSQMLVYMFDRGTEVTNIEEK